MRLALAAVLSLLAMPASAGLIGQSVTLGGVTAVIGDGIEFSGTDAWGQAYTADFSDAGLIVAVRNPQAPPGLSVFGQVAVTLRFTFAQPILQGVTFTGGTFSIPVAPSPPPGCPPLPPDSYYACVINAQPPTQSTMLVAPASLDLNLTTGGVVALTGPATTASFTIATIPEPASAALLGGALLGLAAACRRR